MTHNIPLLRDIMTETKFVKGDISTNYLQEVFPDGFKGRVSFLKVSLYFLLLSILCVCVCVCAYFEGQSFAFTAR